jgi:hypothetical protein
MHLIRVKKCIVSCNKSIFQKDRSSRNMSSSDVRTYLDLSKSMTVSNRKIFIETDCGIDYINAINYIDIVEQLERCFEKPKSKSISVLQVFHFIIMLLCISMK